VLLKSEGEKVYQAQCSACHQKEGTGLGESFPPLANDPVVNGGPVEEHIRTVLNGLNGKVINGIAYQGAMAPFSNLTDNQIAAVITHERTSWGNNGGVVEPQQVASLRTK
jgi:mono/diheme cytochrome c family protein